jgi:hypothetical protein
MKIRLTISKDRADAYSGIYDVVDAESFGRACADAWTRLREQRLEHEPNIGALMEDLDDGVLERLNGATLRVESVDPA